MGCGSHFGGKARWEGFCVDVGLVGALCGTELCAGKRAWLVLAGLHGTPPRFPSCLSLQFHPPCFPSCLSLQPSPPCFPSCLSLQFNPPCFHSCLSLQFHPPCFPSCLTRHSFPSVIFAASPLVFGALCAPSAPALQSILAVWLFNILTLSALLGYPAFRAMQDICLTNCGSGFYVSS